MCLEFGYDKIRVSVIGLLNLTGNGHPNDCTISVHACHESPGATYIRAAPNCLWQACMAKLSALVTLGIWLAKVLL